MPVILATQEVEITRIAVRSQPEVSSLQGPISKISTDTHTLKTKQNKTGLAKWLKW
jgi:hypothetical protein